MATVTVEEHAAWTSARYRAVTAPTGNLALIDTRWGADDPNAALAGQPETVTATLLRNREGLPGVRLWDSESPAIRNFERIDAFAYDPAWVLEARWTDAPDQKPFAHLRDEGRTRDLPVPGDLHLTLAGRDYTLSAFDDDGDLLLVFGDPTNGSQTYGGGRFLIVERVSDELVRLDFNRAFVPPCGFSEHYNCPLPPPQNRLAVPVEAGEKLPIFKAGFEH
ncbi:uncharacterized protein (DUF1684 family) [Actinoplanes tereljensis]|uniref:DUF1684 domain-containing protein n=1 Tax=Paractinoplanes tereljensis TaxID=571912 RepID=A0A919NZM1_9ACTN|nr:DUF1684 domain-containing protein [Actinoplanes tereljensis]GIF26567.1 hypothetical protein Ate02nite_92970 [Actinoplanes tereljensis]